MATRAEGLWATVVHTAPARARAEGLWATVVHTAPPRAQAQGLWATVVHTVDLGGGYAVQGEDVGYTSAQGVGSDISSIDPFEV